MSVHRLAYLGLAGKTWARCAGRQPGHHHRGPLQPLGRVHGGQGDAVGVADPARLQAELLFLGRGQVGQERAQRRLVLVARERRRGVRERVQVGPGAGRVGAGPRGHLDVQPEHPLDLADQVGQRAGHPGTQVAQFRAEGGQPGVPGR